MSSQSRTENVLTKQSGKTERKMSSQSRVGNVTKQIGKCRHKAEWEMSQSRVENVTKKSGKCPHEAERKMSSRKCLHKAERKISWQSRVKNVLTKKSGKAKWKMSSRKCPHKAEQKMSSQRRKYPHKAERKMSSQSRKRPHKAERKMGSKYNVTGCTQQELPAVRNQWWMTAINPDDRVFWELGGSGAVTAAFIRDIGW